jgi:hypothetical protein
MVVSCCVFATGVLAQGQSFFSKDAGAAAQSSDPVGDINEVAVLYGKLYGFDGRVFGAAMTGVFSVECNMKQNCTSPRAFQGSFQNGPKEYEIGVQQARQNIALMQSKGVITPQQVQRFNAALQSAGNDGRLHHLATVWSSLARHAEIHGPFQAAYKQDIHRLAGAQLSFQFAMATKDRVLKGTNGGLDGQLTSAEVSAFANNKGQPGSTLRQSIETITASFKGKIDAGARVASQQTSVGVSQYNPNNTFLNTKENKDLYAATTQPSPAATQPSPQPGAGTVASASPASQQQGSSAQAPQAGSSPAPSGGQGLSPSSPLYDPALQRYAPDTTSTATLVCNPRGSVSYSCDSSVATELSLVSDRSDAPLQTNGLKGRLKVSASETTRYTLTCLSRGVAVGEAACEQEGSKKQVSQVKQSVLPREDELRPHQKNIPSKKTRAILRITTEPVRAARGDKYLVSWDARRGVDQCEVRGPQLKQSGATGEVELVAEKRGTLVYELTCTTRSGGRMSESAHVVVH